METDERGGGRDFTRVPLTLLYARTCEKVGLIRPPIRFSRKFRAPVGDGLAIPLLERYS